MAGTTRRKFTAEFKAEVAVAALRGDKTFAEIAQSYGIHPTMVTQWQGRLEKEAELCFKQRSAKSETLHSNSLPPDCALFPAALELNQG